MRDYLAGKIKDICEHLRALWVKLVSLFQGAESTATPTSVSKPIQATATPTSVSRPVQATPTSMSRPFRPLQTTV